MTNTEVYELLNEISGYCDGRTNCNGCDFKSQETGHCMIKGRPDQWEIGDMDCDTCKSPCVMYEKGARGCGGVK